MKQLIGGGGGGGGGGTPGGSTTQVQFNNAGAFDGISTFTYNGSILTTSGRFINSYNAAASAPAKAFTGTWFTGGTATTTKPQVLIEPTGATSTAWSTAGTGLGVNAASGFAGRLLDLQTNGTSRAVVTGDGSLGIGTPTTTANVDIVTAASNAANNTITGAALRVRNGIGGGENFAIRYSNSGIAGSGFTCQLIGKGNSVLELYSAEATPLVFGTNTVERLRLDSIGSVRVVTALTVATLPGTPAVGMVARVTDATAPAVGVTVVGGGAAAALVWYNGASWSVIGV